MKEKIVLATKNKGKLKEMQRLLADLDCDIVTVDEVAPSLNVIEDGKSFLENSMKKAMEIAQHTGLLAIADDSGLEVDALSGAPGIYSARFAGEGASDQDNNAKLLSLMQDVPDERRTARFKAVIVAWLPDGAFPNKDNHKDKYISADGVCEGKITHKPVGSKGFGYDPVFFLPHLGKTMAELEPEEKNQISHRAKAMQALREKISTLLR